MTNADMHPEIEALKAKHQFDCVCAFVAGAVWVLVIELAVTGF